MKPPLRQSVAGFTLLEMIIVVVIVGILAAIVGPSWLVFLNRQRLNAAQNQALITLRDAQANAKREKRTWEVCFKHSNDNRTQYSVHPVPMNANDSTPVCANASWRDLTEENANKIGVLEQGTTLPYKVQFDYNGLVRDNQLFANANRLALVAATAGEPQPIGKITFAVRNPDGTINSNGSKRCLIVATLIGAIRSAQDNACTQ